MNQFMSNLVCEGFFYHVLLKYGHENAEMQKRKFDDVTLQYSIAHLYTCASISTAPLVCSPVCIFLRNDNIARLSPT